MRVQQYRERKRIRKALRKDGWTQPEEMGPPFELGLGGLGELLKDFLRAFQAWKPKEQGVMKRM